MKVTDSKSAAKSFTRCSSTAPPGGWRRAKQLLVTCTSQARGADDAGIRFPRLHQAPPAQEGITSGPSLQMQPDGRVTSGTEQIARVPPGTWAQLTIEFDLKARSGKVSAHGEGIEAHEKSLSCTATLPHSPGSASSAARQLTGSLISMNEAGLFAVVLLPHHQLALLNTPWSGHAAAQDFAQLPQRHDSRPTSAPRTESDPTGPRQARRGRRRSRPARDCVRGRTRSTRRRRSRRRPDRSSGTSCRTSRLRSRNLSR